MRRFVEERFGLSLSRSSCLNYLHRLGFVLKRPKKRLRKADPVRREAFVGEYAALTAAARRTGVKIFFADEAHFRADGDLRGKWVLKGEPALVDSTSLRRGEKASYYSAVCLETGEVEVSRVNYICRSCCLIEKCYRNFSTWGPSRPALIPALQRVPPWAHQPWRRPAFWP